MGSKSFEQDAGAPPIPVYIAPMMGESDEISLVDLWRVIARRKAIVLASLLLSMLLASIYLYFAEPLYKANAHLLPPQQQSIQALLIEGVHIDDRYTQKFVYNTFLKNLRSKGLRREFFENHDLLSSYVSGAPAADINADRIFEEVFNERLKVQVDKQNASFVTVSFSDSAPELAAQRLNEIIDYVNDRTVDQLFSDVNAAIQAEIGRVRYQLDSKLKLAEQRRYDRIVTLKEALRIAKALGIKDASTFPKMAENTQSRLAVNTAQVPLYMRGINALETEISVLDARKSDEPFIGGFRDIQERQAYLQGISIDADSLSAVTIDQVAKSPYRAERPRKVLVLASALAFGIMLGVCLALFAGFLSRARDDVE